MVTGVMERQTVSVSEAAKILGIGRQTAYDLVALGKLPYVRLGKRILIPRKALDRLLEGNHQTE